MDTKYDYFIDQTNKRFDQLHDDVKEIRKDVRTLLAFRMMLMGGAAAMGGLVSFIINLAMIWVERYR